MAENEAEQRRERLGEDRDAQDGGRGNRARGEDGLNPVPERDGDREEEMDQFRDSTKEPGESPTLDQTWGKQR